MTIAHLMNVIFLVAAVAFAIWLEVRAEKKGYPENRVEIK